MKCHLGIKKLRRIATLTGKSVSHAYVRGGWRHYLAETWFMDGTVEMVNYRSGEREPVLQCASPWWNGGSPPDPTTAIHPSAASARASIGSAA